MHRPIPAAWGFDSQVLEASSASSKKRVHSSTCNFMDVVSFKPDVSWQDQRESDLQRGIKLWVAVSSRWDCECSFMCKLAEMRDSEETFDMFAHVFSGRAPVTVRKRGFAILKLCDYLEGQDLEQFPMLRCIAFFARRSFWALQPAGCKVSCRRLHFADMYWTSKSCKLCWTASGAAEFQGSPVQERDVKPVP